MEREQGTIKQTSTDVLRGHTKIKSTNPQDVNYIRSAIVGQLQTNLFGSTLADQLENDDLSAEEEGEEENVDESKHSKHKKHDRKERRDKNAMEE